MNEESIDRISKKLNVLKAIVSQQLDSNGNPIVNLSYGDEVELRNDGIYFTRKINTPIGSDLESVFNGICNQNTIK